MATEVGCPNCSKRYAVLPAMIGKRVRCRNCSTVFPILLDQTADEAADTVTAPPPTLFSPASAESQFEEALGCGGSPARRLNTRFKFPLARELDKYLPTAMIIVGALWTASQTFRSPDAGPMWTSLLRLAIVYGLYVIVVVPGIMIGIRRIATRLNYELPPMPAWRAAAVFALPITLGYVFWIVAGANGMFIVGCLIGLLFSAAAFWLLFRLQPQEIAPSYAAAGGGFAASVLISIGAMLLINLFLNAALKGGEVAGALHQSPIGPTFAWDPGSPKVHEHGSELAQQTPARRHNDASAMRDQAAAIGSDQAAPGNRVATGDDHAASSTSQPPVADDQMKVAQTSESHILPQTSPKTIEASQPPSVTASSSPGTARTGSGIFDLPPGTLEEEKSPSSDQPPSDDAWLAALRAKALPFVKDVQPAKAIGPFDDLIYPMTPSPWIAIVRHSKDGQQDNVEVRNLNTSEVVGSKMFPRPTGGNAACKRYALSPDGQLLVCQDNFPRLTFPVFSFKDGRFFGQTITDGMVAPELIGFISNDKLLIECKRNQQGMLEVFDARTSRRIANYPVPNHMHLPGNGEISPDGKWFAVAASVDRKAVLKLYPVTSLNASAVTCNISDLDPYQQVRPLGIAFSPDSSKVAAIFGRAGQGDIVYWNLKDRKEKSQLFPALPPQMTRIADGGGRVIDWIGNDAWLLGGDVIVDVNTGTVLGSFGDDSVQGQHPSTDGSLHILYQLNNMTRVASIQMEPAKLRNNR